MRTDILEQAKALRASMDAAAAVLTDEQAVKAPMIYRPWSSDSVAYAACTAACCTSACRGIPRREIGRRLVLSACGQRY